MDYAKAHAIKKKAEEAALKVCELPCCFGNGKKKTGFGGYQKFMRWDPSHLLSCPAEGKDSSETPGGKPQGASNVDKQIWIQGRAGLFVIATTRQEMSKCTRVPLGLVRKSPK